MAREIGPGDAICGGTIAGPSGIIALVFDRDGRRGAAQPQAAAARVSPAPRSSGDPAMKDKGKAALGLLAAAVLSWAFAPAPAGADDSRDAAAKPAENAARDPADKPAKKEAAPAGNPPKKPPATPRTQPAKKPPKKPPQKPPKKKPDDGIAPDDPWRETQAARMERTGHLLGPPLGLADLKGQVLLVANWDSNREKTKRLLPALVRLDSQYRRKGLVLIGARKYHRDRQQAAATARQYGVKFPVYGGVFVPDTNFRKFEALKTPYCYVLDHTGKVIFEDRPNSRMMGTVQSALRKRPHPAIGEAKYPKSGAILTKIRAGRLGDAVALCKKAKEKEGQAGEEAGTLLAALERNATRLLAKAEKSLKLYPQHALETFSQVKKEYAGSPFGDKADARLKELAKDESLQNELAAEKQLRPVIQALGTVTRFPYDRKASEQNRWIRRHGQTLKSAKAKIGRLRKKYAETRAFQEAEAFFKEVMPAKPEK
jgi:hypothetical protein